MFACLVYFFISGAFILVLIFWCGLDIVWYRLDLLGFGTIYSRKYEIIKLFFRFNVEI